SGFAEHGAVPRLSARLSTNVEAALRGRAVLPPSSGDAAVELPGTFPFVLHDPALASVDGPIDVYTWPTDLPMAHLDGGGVEPLPPTPISRADIVRDLSAGRWTVDGFAPGPYSYLLEFREQPIAEGAHFVIRGDVQEGGFTVGLLRDGRWSMYVNVTQPGP